MSDEAPELALEGGALALRFGYHPRRVAAVKRVPGARFDRERKGWLVPRRRAPDLLAALQEAEAPEAWLAAVRPFAQTVLAELALRQAAWTKRAEAVLPGLDARHPGLFPHQREGVAFLLAPRAEKGALLADEMGLGKSRQAIVAAHEGHPEGPLLVLCPAALKLNWAREIRLALGPAAEVSVLGSGAAAISRWTIVNYDLLKRHAATLAEVPWGCAIVDEAHYLKHPRALRTRLALGEPGRPGLLARAERVFLLTGTPITNRPLDLFPLLGALEHPLGDERLAFAARYCHAVHTGWGWDFNGASNLEELHERLAPVLLRRTREETLDLPPKLRTYMPVEVDLTAYRRFWLAYAAEARHLRRRGKGMTRRALLVEIAKLKQAAAIAKIPAAVALASELVAAGDKVVVFSSYRAVISALEAHFGPTAVSLTGATPAKSRQAVVERFQGDPAVRVFLGNLRSAGTGISLTAARQVVFVDYAYVPSDHLQAEDRPCRIGQRQALTVTYLSAVGTLDEDIERLLAQKLVVMTTALDGQAPPERASFLDDLLEIVARSGAGD